MNRSVLRGIALIAIVVGIISLLGIRPMNSRTIEMTLGSASLVAGIALWAVAIRRRPTPIA